MRIELSPLGVYIARQITIMLGTLVCDWAYGVDARLDLPYWLYIGIFVFSLVSDATDYRIRRSSGERAIIDLRALIRTRAFWKQVGIIGFVILFVALAVHDSSSRNPRFVLGFALWVVLLTIANLNRRGRDHMKAHPYISFPWRRVKTRP